MNDFNFWSYVYIVDLVRKCHVPFQKRIQIWGKSAIFVEISQRWSDKEMPEMVELEYELKKYICLKICILQIKKLFSFVDWIHGVLLASKWNILALTLKSFSYCLSTRDGTNIQPLFNIWPIRFAEYWKLVGQILQDISPSISNT